MCVCLYFVDRLGRRTIQNGMISFCFIMLSARVITQFVSLNTRANSNFNGLLAYFRILSGALIRWHSAGSDFSWMEWDRDFKTAIKKMSDEKFGQKSGKIRDKH